MLPYHRHIALSKVFLIVSSPSHSTDEQAEAFCYDHKQYPINVHRQPDVDPRIARGIHSPKCPSLDLPFLCYNKLDRIFFICASKTYPQELLVLAVITNSNVSKFSGLSQPCLSSFPCVLHGYLRTSEKPWFGRVG